MAGKWRERHRLQNKTDPVVCWLNWLLTGSCDGFLPSERARGKNPVLPTPPTITLTKTMTSNYSDLYFEGEFTEGKAPEEESFQTPVYSSPDSCVTSTLSCETKENTVLVGSFHLSNQHFELTLALIKPDGMKYRKEIEKRIKDEGFYVVQTRRIHLSPEHASNFYQEHYGRPYFPFLVSAMCEGPSQVYVLRRKDAVVKWRMLCGPVSVDQAKAIWPESLRAIFGTAGETFRNICHGSATEEQAKKDIKFFFPNMILDENLTDQIEVEDYLKEFVNPTLLEGLAQVCKNKPQDPLEYLAQWLLIHNPYKPIMEDNIAIAPT